MDYEELAKAHYRIATLEESLQKLKEEGAIAPVEDRDVATVIELWTGIPAARIQENELRSWPIWKRCWRRRSSARTRR